MKKKIVKYFTYVDDFVPGGLRAIEYRMQKSLGRLFKEINPQFSIASGERCGDPRKLGSVTFEEENGYVNSPVHPSGKSTANAIFKVFLSYLNGGEETANEAAEKIGRWSEGRLTAKVDNGTVVLLKTKQ